MRNPENTSTGYLHCISLNSREFELKVSELYFLFIGTLLKSPVAWDCKIGSFLFQGGAMVVY